ncbi:MAG: DUF2341 domain-containing protein [Saprospiraceae bacterium]
MKNIILWTLSLLPFSIHLYAQGDCLPGWGYFREIEISNNAGAALADFQIAIPFNTAELLTAGKLRSDGADLRVLDEDCAPLSFFADSAAASANNVIWVRIGSLAQGETKTIRMYYGNAGEADPAADGDATFLFFDDFSSGAVDPAKWEPVGEYATLEVVDGMLHYASTAAIPGPRFKFLRSLASFSDPVIWDLNITTNANGSFGHCSASDPLQRTLFRYNTGASDTLSHLALMLDTTSNGYVYSLSYPDLIVPRNMPQEISVVTRVNNDDHLVYNYFGANTQGTSTTAALEVLDFSATAVQMIFSTFSASNTVYVDYVRVRRPVLDQPGLTFGGEQVNPGASSVFDYSVGQKVRCFPNPASGELYLEREAGSGALQVRLFDGLGRVVYSGEWAEGVYRIPLSSSWKGLYWLSAGDWSQGVVVE